MSSNDFIITTIFTAASILAGWGYTVMVTPGSNARVARVMFWISAIGFGTLGAVWAANQEHLTAMNLSIAGVVGAVAAIALTWVLWQVEHPAMAQDLPAKSSDQSPVNIAGSGNVVSIGQTGGVTAGTYVNQVSAARTSVD
jgi:hypothetical protein